MKLCREGLSVERQSSAVSQAVPAAALRERRRDEKVEQGSRRANDKADFASVRFGRANKRLPAPNAAETDRATFRGRDEMRYLFP